MTFSLVACAGDELGVVVASKFLAVGALVHAVEAGVGAVASQALANPAYREKGLTLLRAGLDPQAALDRLVADDPGGGHRQAGIVDAAGQAATFTGESCIPWAGGRTGPGYAAQGNILVSVATIDALAESFEASPSRPLAERLLDALAAGQAAGGDSRGQQSAALIVARAGAGYGGCDVTVDLRVDDHPTPIKELRRLYQLHDLLFGSTPAEEWLDVDQALVVEMTVRLAELGYATGVLADDFGAWVGVTNLEQRIDGIERIDPVVLGVLRGL